MFRGAPKGHECLLWKPRLCTGSQRETPVSRMVGYFNSKSAIQNHVTPVPQYLLVSLNQDYYYKGHISNKNKDKLWNIHSWYKPSLCQKSRHVLC